jgi:hypothetical protein
MLPKELFFKYSDMYWGTESEVCVGEDVKLIIESGDGLNFEEIKDKTEFRILNFNNELVASFPLVKEGGTLESDWQIDGNKLVGKLNLNTTELVDMFKGFGSIKIDLPFIATLDVLEDNNRASVFNTQIKLSHWQRVTMPEGTVSVKSYVSYLERKINEINNELLVHEGDQTNPHNVTASQVGAYTKEEANIIYEEINDDIGRLRTIINSKADTTELDKAKESFNSHESDTNNPHNVTAEQIDAYTKSEVDNKLSAFGNAINYQGTVDTKSDLPTNANRGDLYNVEDTGLNYIWDGNEWDELSPFIDLSGYVTKKDFNSHTNNYNNPHRVTPKQIGAYTKDEVDNKLENITTEESDPNFSAWKDGVSIALGLDAEVNADVSGVAIGFDAKVTAQDAVQIGGGINDKPNTVQFGSYTLLDGDGKIDPARILKNSMIIKDVNDSPLVDGVWTISSNDSYNIYVFNIPFNIAVENRRFSYNGEFIIDVTEEMTDMTLTFVENRNTSLVWVGDIPNLSIIGKHHFAYKVVDYSMRNTTLYLNEYFVEEAEQVEEV